MQYTKPDTHTELSNRQWMDQAGNIVDMSYEISFNGMGVVEVLLPTLGWSSQFAITLNAPDTEEPDTAFIANVLRSIDFLPGENLVSNEDEAGDAMRLVDLMVADILNKERLTTVVSVSAHGEAHFILTVRPVLRHSTPGWCSMVGQGSTEHAVETPVSSGITNTLTTG